MLLFLVKIFCISSFYLLLTNSFTYIFFILQNSEAMVSIDMPAGPSEVLVIADKYAKPAHIAADLLSQVLISCSST